MSILKAGFVASIPAVCGFVGGVLGGIISDWLMRRTGSLNIARKTPIVLGMLLSMTMLMCNYVNAEWMIIGFMAMAFFGKGIGALGWAVMADTAPKEISGLSGGLFNMFGNISGIVTPIAIGYIVGTTGSFNGALIYVGIHALVAVFSYRCWLAISNVSNLNRLRGVNHEYPIQPNRYRNEGDSGRRARQHADEHRRRA